MHGIWLLVFAPIAAVVAWRYSGVALRKLALYAMVLAGVALVGWFSYLSIEGADLVTSIYDRVMHAMGVIVGSINVPIVQFLLATVIVVSWPRKYEFRPSKLIPETDTE